MSHVKFFADISGNIRTGSPRTPDVSKSTKATYKAQYFPFLLLGSNMLSPFKFMSSLFPIDTKALIISFGKSLSLSLSLSPSPLRLLSSLQPDLQYYLSLGMWSPLVISQSQTPKAHTIMGNIKRVAMTSTSKLSTITFGFASYCELYFLPSDIVHLLISCR